MRHAHPHCSDDHTAAQCYDIRADAVLNQIRKVLEQHAGGVVLATEALEAILVMASDTVYDLPVIG